MAPPRLDFVSGGSRGGVWSHGLPGHPFWSLKSLSPYLEVTGVGPEADPAHVFQEYVQGVPCPAHYMQRCLPVPLQRSLVLLKPRGQCCWSMLGSHHPNTASRHIAFCCQPRQSQGCSLPPKKGANLGPRATPQRLSMAFGTLAVPRTLAWQSPTASRSHSPLEHCPRDWCAPLASPSAASHSHGHRCYGEERPAWRGPGHPRAAVCGTPQSHRPAGHSAVA